MEGQDYTGITELEPGAFDWLDLAEEFFKHDGSFGFGEERNDCVIRAGEIYGEIEREWEQLNRLHDACPEYFVEPLKPVFVEKEGERRMAGFYTERFDGQDLGDYLLNSTM